MAEETTSGRIRFSRYWRAPLEAGEYKVVVGQTVAELHEVADPAAPFSSVNYDFVVNGPRFALNPADIYSIYPPEGATGDFASSMPHIVFARPTIPWERRLSSGAPDHQPWMALLLFSGEDGDRETGIPRIEPRKVRDLIQKLPPDVAGPRNLIYEEYELDDPCNTIDVDAGLFRRVAPGRSPTSTIWHMCDRSTPTIKRLPHF